MRCADDAGADPAVAADAAADAAAELAARVAEVSGATVWLYHAGDRGSTAVTPVRETRTGFSTRFTTQEGGETHG